MYRMKRLCSVGFVLSALFACTQGLAPTPLDFTVAPDPVRVDSTIHLALSVPSTDPDGSDDAITYAVSFAKAQDAEGAKEPVENWNRDGLSAADLEALCWAPADTAPPAESGCDEESTISDEAVHFENGQVWEITVEATDETGLLAIWNPTRSFVVGNSPPSTEDSSFEMVVDEETVVYTDSDIVYAYNDLSVRINAVDADMDELFYSLKWTCSPMGTILDEPSLTDRCMGVADPCADVTLPADAPDVAKDEWEVVSRDKLRPCQVWTATGSVSDGTSQSSEMSGSVVVGDAPPQVFSVTLTEDVKGDTAAHIEESITCRWSYSDLEESNDETTGTGIGSKVTWSGCTNTAAAAAVQYDSDGDEYYVTATPGELNCAKTNTLKCEVTPIDAGAVQGVLVSSGAIEIVNAPPSYKKVILEWDGSELQTPSDPLADTELRCVADSYNDPDGDEQASPVLHAWRIGGDLVPGEDGSYLTGLFKKGQAVNCEATPNDGEEDGETVDSDPVVIEDSQPTATNVAIPSLSGGSEASRGDTIGCEYAFVDVDEDTQEDSEFYWVDENEGDYREFTTSQSESSEIEVDDSFEIGDEVFCMVVPVSDGLAGKPETSTNPVTIVNADPTVDNVTIIPTGQSGRGDTLSCIADNPSDPEGGDVETTYKWKDSATAVFHETSTVDLSTKYVDFPNISSGNTVQCVATVSDTDGGETIMKKTFTILNTLPTLANGTISEVGEGASAALTCSFEPDDIDDEQVDITYAWTNQTDAGVDFSSVESETLNLDEFPDVEKDDEIQCAGTPEDTTGSGTEAVAMLHTVGNTLPAIETVTIDWPGSPSAPQGTDTLTCNALPMLDADGETIIYSYAWSQSGTLLSGLDENTLDLAALVDVSEGTEIMCEVTPADSEGEGDPMTDTVSVGNTPPSITRVDIEDASGASIDANTTEAECTYQASDPEEDPINADYSWSLEGTDLNLTTDTIDLTTISGAEWGLELECTVTVSDTQMGDEASGSVVLGDADPVWAGGGDSVIEPENPFLGDRLECVHDDAVDSDGSLVEYEYVWIAYTDGTGTLAGGFEKITGEVEQTLATYPSPNGIDLGPGARIKCLVTGSSDTDSAGIEETTPNQSPEATLEMNEHPTEDGTTVLNQGSEVTVWSDYLLANGDNSLFPPDYGLNCLYSLCTTCGGPPPVDPEGHELRTRLSWLRTPGDGATPHIIGSWAALTVGPRHGCAYNSEEREVQCWGEDIDGSLDGWDRGGFGVDAPGVLKAGEDYTCAIDLTNDEAACWGGASGATPPAWVSDVPTSGIIDVAPGVNHTCWLTDEGYLGCAGDDTYGQVTDFPSDGSYVAVDSGVYHSCALNDAGVVNCWGIDDGGLEDEGQVTSTPSVTFSSIDVGGFHACGVRSDAGNEGRVDCWGRDQGTIGGTGPQNTAGAYESVWAGDHHSCVVTVDGEAACWSNESGEHVSTPFEQTDQDTRKAFLTNVVAIAPGFGTTCLLFEEGGFACYEDSLRLHAEGASNLVAFPPEKTHLDPAYVDGDTVECLLEVVDTYGKLAEFTSSPVQIAASSGTVTEACVEWELQEPQSYENMDFECVSDATGIPQYTWWVHTGADQTGTRVFDDVGGKVFNPASSLLSVNDVESVTCTVDYAGCPSCPSTSSTVNISAGTETCDQFNTEPYIASICVTGNAVDTLTCEAVAEDVDNDSVTIAYQWTVVTATATNAFFTAQVSYDPAETISATCAATPHDGDLGGGTVSLAADLSTTAQTCADVSISVVADFGGATCLEAGESNVGCNYSIVDFDGISYTDTSQVAYSVTSSILLDLPTFESFDAGFEQVCAVGLSGELRCWGEMINLLASEQVPTALSDPNDGSFDPVEELSVAREYVGVIAGTLESWGAASRTLPLANVEDADLQVVSGDGYTCSIHNGGELECAGGLGTQEVVTAANVNPDLFRMIDAGFTAEADSVLCGITTNGEIMCADNKSMSGLIVTDVPTGTNWETVSVGSKLACAIDAVGELQCWGMGNGNLPTAQGARAVATAELAVCYIDATNQIDCFYGGMGSPDEPPAGRYTDITAGTVNSKYYFCALATGGTVHCWGEASAANGVLESVFEAPGLGELENGDTLECSVTPCQDDGVDETCGPTVTVSIPVQTSCP